MQSSKDFCIHDNKITIFKFSYNKRENTFSLVLVLNAFIFYGTGMAGGTSEMV